MTQFSSFAAEQRQVLQVFTVLSVFETRSFAKTNFPIRSSETTCNTPAASCRRVEVKWDIPNIRHLAFKDRQKV